MIGQWESKEGEAVVKAKCDWAKNKNFITRSFSISIKDKLEISGTQVCCLGLTRLQIRNAREIVS